MPSAAASRPALASTAVSGSVPVTGGAHSAIRAAGAVVKPLRTPAGVVGRRARLDERKVSGGGMTGEEPFERCRGLFRGERPVDADHDEAGETVREASEGEVGVADSEEHAGLAGSDGIDRPA